MTLNTLFFARPEYNKFKNSGTTKAPVRMSSQQVAHRQAQPLRCPVDQAMHRLLATSEMIQYRARIRPNDAERITDALMLAREADPPETTRERNYWEFLRSIARDCGDEIVGLCALSLGRSVIGNMKGCFRLELSRRIRNNRMDFDCPVLRDSLQANSANCHSDAQSHTPVEHNQRMRIGDVHLLTMDDVRALVNSDHATGTVCLYVSDDVNFEPWITVTIPRELSAQLVMNRPRLM